MKELCSRQDLAGFIVCLSFFKIFFTHSDHLYQALLGTSMKLYMADTTLLVVRPTSIKLALLLANVHTNLHLLCTPVFNAVYRLTPSLDHQPSLDSCRAMMRPVCLYSLPLKQRLNFSTGSQMAPGS